MEQKLETAKREKSCLLDLSRSDVKDVPDLTGLTEVNAIYFRHNKIETVDLAKFENLENLYIDFSDNEITKITEGANQIKHISLYRNRLRSIEFTLQKCESINLSYNPIRDLSFITSKNFPKLKQLIVNNCQIYAVPDTLPDLDRLDMSGNMLKTITNLPRTLTYLNVRNNQIELFTASIHNLEHLDAGMNRLLSFDLRKSARLKTVDLSHNLLYEIDIIDKYASINLSNNRLVKLTQKETPSILDISNNQFTKDPNVKAIMSLKTMGNPYLNETTENKVDNETKEVKINEPNKDKRFPGEGVQLGVAPSIRPVPPGYTPSETHQKMMSDIKDTKTPNTINTYNPHTPPSYSIVTHRGSESHAARERKLRGPTNPHYIPLSGRVIRL